MVDVRAFSSDIETVINRMDDHLEKAIREGLSESYSYIFQQWPAYTYYSMANNVVSLRAPIENPVPSERPNDKDELADDAAIQLETGLQILNTFKMNKTRDTKVYINNPVDYASDVGFNTGAGDAIYQEAAQAASEAIERSWFNRITFGI